ncbi:hypothetical protein MIR68_008488 [Amoeboaphelidium protococcarum]|nr:hypothetical protein MIR68_008488 [Amoeboaphelidium protococcarum]
MEGQNLNRNYDARSFNATYDNIMAQSVFDMTPAQLQLPQSNKTAICKYYIRDCYDEYYEYLIQTLDKKKFITTVSGTPSIGKSIFYAHFFQKYRESNPFKQIVTAAFDGSRQLKKVVVYPPYKGVRDGSQEIQHARSANCEVQKIDSRDLITDYPDAIHLYDGPPTFFPDYAQMICFTCPNYSWFKSIWKSAPAIYYMPFWSLDELLEARELLNLDISQAEVERRYSLVGGTARICLTLDLDQVQEYIQELQVECRGIKSYSQLNDFVVFNANTKEVAHEMLFIKPEFGPFTTVRMYKLQFCSAFAADEVQKSIIDQSEHDKFMFISLLKADPRASSLLGWIFESDMRKKLTSGGQFELLPLGDSLAVGGSVSLDFGANQYKHVHSSNYPVFDGLLELAPNQLYLFQITLNYDHDVKSGSLIEFLVKEGYADREDLNINLVFVVCKGMDDFKARKIELEMRSIENCPVKSLSGIGIKRAASLANHGYNTASELINGVEEGVVKQQIFVNAVKRFRLVEGYKSLLSKISQFLLVSDLDYKFTN